MDGATEKGKMLGLRHPCLARSREALAAHTDREDRILAPNTVIQRPTKRPHFLTIISIDLSISVSSLAHWQTQLPVLAYPPSFRCPVSLKPSSASRYRQSPVVMAWPEKDIAHFASDSGTQIVGDETDARLKLRSLSCCIMQMPRAYFIVGRMSDI